ncbi:MAG: DoxX family protein [Micropruina sp.]|nr:DoxX family protein [Micropruina sp.]
MSCSRGDACPPCQTRCGRSSCSPSSRPSTVCCASKPAAFIAACFEDVRWPRRLWWLMPPVKFAAAAGLVAGIWIPYLGTVTSLALVAYFVVAIGAHVRARDFGRNLFVNATGMLLVCLAVTLVSFIL